MFVRIFPDINEFLEMSKSGNLIPVSAEILADTETPVSALRKLISGGKNSFLLESVEGGVRWGRYSFLGNSSRFNILVFPEHVEIKDGEKTEKITHNGNPLGVLREIMSKYRPVAHEELPRFWGGLVGYFTYEAVSFFEKIDNNLPPEFPLAKMMLTDSLIIFDNVRHSMFVTVHVFTEDDSDTPSLYENAVKRINEIIDLLLKQPDAEEEPQDKEFVLLPRTSPKKFMDGVGKVKNYIIEGDIIQAVISQKFRCAEAPDPWLLYRVQRYINPSPYLFYLEIEDDILVGSSPETMVRLENRIATVRPIAGTRPRGKNEQEDRRLADDLLNDSKEKAEHLMLVDLGRNDLGRIAETGTVQVTDLMFVERYSHVMHLVSNVTADLLRNLDAWDLLRATFPAGTLSGAPKVRAMEIISEVEGDFRGPYGGAVGYISFDGNMDFAITIRTAWIHENTLTVQAGAGIVADSDPQSEQQECLNKAKAMEKALKMISGRKQKPGGI